MVFVGLFGLGGFDFDLVDEDVVVGSVFVVGVCIGNDVDVFGLEGKSDDFVVEVVVGLLEGFDGSYCCFFD